MRIDILGIDIMGVYILGIGIVALPQLYDPTHFDINEPHCGICGLQDFALLCSLYYLLHGIEIFSNQLF